MTPYYERDGITIYHADCLDVLPTLEAVDHVITDAPYSRDLYLSFRSNKGARGSDGQQSDNHLALANMTIGAVEDVLPAVAPEFVRLALRWTVVFHDAESGHLWRDALGEHYIRAGVWVKPNAVPQISGDRPGQGFESITIAHPPGRKRWNGGGRPAVWTFNAENSQAAGRPGHPCPKPLALMRQLVADFTDPGDLILDAFGGSMTTAVAAYQLGRRCIAIEREERYCEIGAKRLAQMPLPLEAEAPPKRDSSQLAGGFEWMHTVGAGWLEEETA